MALYPPKKPPVQSKTLSNPISLTGSHGGAAAKRPLVHGQQQQTAKPSAAHTRGRSEIVAPAFSWERQLVRWEIPPDEARRIGQRLEEEGFEEKDMMSLDREALRDLGIVIKGAFVQRILAGVKASKHSQRAASSSVASSIMPSLATSAVTPSTMPPPSTVPTSHSGGGPNEALADETEALFRTLAAHDQERLRLLKEKETQLKQQREQQLDIGQCSSLPLDDIYDRLSDTSGHVRARSGSATVSVDPFKRTITAGVHSQIPIASLGGDGRGPGGLAVPAEYDPNASKPRSLLCYLCGREFGTASLLIHQPQCQKKWKQREKLKKDKRMRRKLPKPPSINIDISNPEVLNDPQAVAAFNEAANAAYLARVLCPCPHCGRSFFEESLVAHLHHCTAERPMPRGRTTSRLTNVLKKSQAQHDEHQQRWREQNAFTASGKALQSHNAAEEDEKEHKETTEAKQQEHEQGQEQEAGQPKSEFIQPPARSRVGTNATMSAGTTEEEEEEDDDDEDGEGDREDSTQASAQSALEEEAEMHFQQRVALLRKGTLLMKHGRWGKPKPKVVFGNSEALFWCDPMKRPENPMAPVPKSLPLTEVVDVIPGKETRVFRRFVSREAPPSLCFSVVTASRSLNLQAATEEDRDHWMDAIQYMVSCVKQRSSMARALEHLTGSAVDESKLDHPSWKLHTNRPRSGSNSTTMTAPFRLDTPSHASASAAAAAAEAVADPRSADAPPDAGTKLDAPPESRS